MQYDDLFKALADEHRRGIVTALCEQPVVAGELARRVGLAPNALSFHLRWLRSAGLIDMQRKGRHLWYHVNGPALNAWRNHVNSAFFTSAPHPPATLAAPAPRPHAAAPRPAPAAVSSRASETVHDDVFLPDELL